MNLRVTVVGGGNLGLACAARLASAGTEVTLFTSAPGKWTREIAVVDCQERTFSGCLAQITSDPKIAANCDLVFLCLPGNAMKDRLPELRPHLAVGTPVASVFSADGFFFIAEEVLGARWPVLGFQRVPFISRTRVPYKVGGITGYRKELRLAHRSVDNPGRWRVFFEKAFDTPTVLLDNFYEAALANSNPVIHPARLMSLRRAIERNGPFKRMPLFYEEWDDVASEYAVRLDAELCAIAAAKGAQLMPLLTYYESIDIRSFTRKIRSIPAFKGIGSPILETGVLDYSSRYIQADILVSLPYIVSLATRAKVPHPGMDEVLSYDWKAFMRR